MGDKRFSLEQMKMNARITPMGEGRGGQRSLLFHFTIFGAAFAIACLYHGMRGIMRLGGMVASGGPYAIEHPAPGWAWVLPVSIMFGMACFFLNLFSGREGGVNLMPLAWPGLFLSCGWNFLEFGLPGGGIVWGWLVCGVIFVAMGGLPLLLAFRAARERVRAQLGSETGIRPYVVQWLLIAAGIVAAIYVFRALAGKP